MTASKEIQRDRQRLTDNLMLLQRNFGVQVLSELLGISRNTWTNKMKCPCEKFSYGELRSISRFCRIDFVKLVDGELKIN